MIKGGLRIRRENHKDRREEFRPDGERDRLFKYGRIVLIKSKDERSTDCNAVSVEGINDVPVLRRIVLKFFGFCQGFFGKGLKANEKAVAPALSEQFYIFDVLQSG